MTGRGLVAAALTLLGLRLWLAGRLELSPDEALYVTWAWGSAGTDHPPLLPWLLRLALHAPTSLERAARLVPAGCALGTWWLLDRLLVAWKASARARWTLFFSGLLPLPATGALIATPDGPMVLCTACALVGALRAQEAPRWRWAVVLAAPLALLCKVQALGLLPALLALAPKSERRALFLALLAQLAVLPLALPSLRFQLVHAFTAQGPAPGLAAPVRFPLEGVLALVAGQLGLFLPALPWVTRALHGPRVRGLLGFALLSLLPVLTSAWVRIPEASWSAPAVPAVMVLLALGAERLGLRRHAAGCVLTALGATLLHLQAGWAVLPLRPAQDPTSRLRGWRAVVCAGATHPWRPLPPYALPAERAVYAGRCAR